MDDKKAAWSDRLHAANSVLKFAGLEPPKKLEHSGEIKTTDEAAIAARIAALEAELLVREED